MSSAVGIKRIYVQTAHQTTNSWILWEMINSACCVRVSKSWENPFPHDTMPFVEEIDADVQLLVEVLEQMMHLKKLGVLRNVVERVVSAFLDPRKKAMSPEERVNSGGDALRTAVIIDSNPLGAHFEGDLLLTLPVPVPSPRPAARPAPPCSILWEQ